jgi:hypothetical protein
MEYGQTAYNRTVYASPPYGGSGFRSPRATLIKSMLIGDLRILLRKHRIKAVLAALAHSRLN